MSVEAVEVERPRQRAGFLRRVFAVLLDMALVLIPLQVLVAILFSQTNGAVQGSFGLASTSCALIERLPEGLEPPPPADFNFITVCSSSLLGWETGRSLIVGTQSQVGNTRTAVWQAYALGADGKPKDYVLDVSWIAGLLLFAYLVLMESRTGTTVGKRSVEIQVIGVREPTRAGIRLRRAIVRNLAMFIGAVPALLTSLVPLILVDDAAELQALVLSSTYRLLLVLNLLFAAGWAIWVVVSMARKKDPPYDRIAGTAVVLK